MIDLCVMIRVDTDFFSAQMKSKAAVVNCFQFVVGLEFRKSPQTAVDDVREALFLRYLHEKKRKTFNVDQRSIFHRICLTMPRHF